MTEVKEEIKKKCCNPKKKRSVWEEEHIRFAIDTYDEMLSLEKKGEKFVKAQYNRKVAEATGKSRGSVEMFFCNISGAFQDAGQGFIKGYKPYPNRNKKIDVILQEKMAQLAVSSTALLTIIIDLLKAA